MNLQRISLESRIVCFISRKKAAGKHTMYLCGILYLAVEFAQEAGLFAGWGSCSLDSE